jgi:hypothetical protein
MLKSWEDELPAVQQELAKVEADLGRVDLMVRAYVERCREAVREIPTVQAHLANELFPVEG